MKKILIIISISLLLVLSVNPIFCGDTKLIYTTTIYVDDDNTMGPWDGSADHPYRYIQQALDNASNGDTIYVLNGYYHETNLSCNTSVSLIGEDQHHTIIDGFYNDSLTFPSTFLMTGNNINITQFCFKNYTILLGNSFEDFYSHRDGFIRFTYNTIENSLVSLFFTSFSDQQIDCVISHNHITARTAEAIGMICGPSKETVIISHNVVDGCGIGLLALGNVLAQQNQFSGCRFAGVFAYDYFGGSTIDFSQNNFIDNTVDANFYYDYDIEWNRTLSSFHLSASTASLMADLLSDYQPETKGFGDIKFTQNYWDANKGFGPKFILGEFSITLDIIKGDDYRHFTLPIPWIHVDWNPAEEPYDIADFS